MPWSGDQYRKRFNNKLNQSQAAEAARIANALLREGKDDASAIRIANATVKKGKKGGK
jgi:uncharacterized protein YdaT